MVCKSVTWLCCDLKFCKVLFFLISGLSLSEDRVLNGNKKSDNLIQCHLFNGAVYSLKVILTSDWLPQASLMSQPYLQNNIQTDD